VERAREVERELAAVNLVELAVLAVPLVEAKEREAAPELAASQV